MMKLKSIAYSTVTVALGVAIVFPTLEPVIARAAVATDAVIVTQTVTSGIAINAPADITMTALSTSQNTAVGSTTWTVTTNNQAGYKLEVNAGTNPALRDGATSETFANYTETVTGTPETWSVTSAYEFGFSGYGTHVPSATWGTDADCIAGANVPSTGLKWRGFNALTLSQLATSSSETGTSGTGSTFCVATQQQGIFAPSGSYTATITATATTL